MGAVLQIQLVVALGVAEQKVGDGISGETSVEGVVSLGIAEDVLVLGVAHELTAESQVVIALDPGDVVTHLLVPGSVSPGPGCRVVINAVTTSNADGRQAIQGVVIEELRCTPSRRLLVNAERRQINPVAIEV